MTSLGNITMWPNRSQTGPDTTSLEFKEQRQIKVEKGFLKFLCVSLRFPNGQVNYLRYIHLSYFNIYVLTENKIVVFSIRFNLHQIKIQVI